MVINIQINMSFFIDITILLNPLMMGSEYMNKKCIVCRFRTNCLTYQLGGLYEGERCDKFIEEPEITEEEQEKHDQEQLNKKSIVKKIIEKIKRS